MPTKAPPIIRSMADVTINGDIQNYLEPIMASLIGLAGLVSAFFLVMAGIEYMTSAGKPDKLAHAKTVMRNALLGLVVVVAAGTLTAVLGGAYGQTGGDTAGSLPSVATVEPEDGGGITEVLLEAITALFRHIIETAGAPFISGLQHFTEATPLAGDNPSVFRLWLVVAGIANSLFVLAMALIGFQLMSAASLGLDEIEPKRLLPRLAVVFLLMNSSIFVIDAVIGLSNAMIGAVTSAAAPNVWNALLGITENAGGYGLVALMIMVVFLVLATILMVYYIMRIVIIYVGAVLAPLAILLSVLPGFRDFTMTAVKSYLTVVFVLFVHVIILTLAASLFKGLPQGDAETTIMAMLIGVASLVTLLKTQGVMMQISYVSVGPKAIRRLGSQFMNGVSYTASRARSVRRPGTRGGTQ